jgi:polyferredoxin
MTKVGKPKGLIRYTSLDEMKFSKPLKALYKRPRVIVYSAILLTALSILAYSMFNIPPMELNILHGRTPLYVQLSDGSIRNKYELKVMNKTDQPMLIDVSFMSAIKYLKSQKEHSGIVIPSGNVKSIYIYLKAFERDIGDDDQVVFLIKSNSTTLERASFFASP